MAILKRNNVLVSGRSSGPGMLFAHGYGCDQNMWRFVAPAFESDYRVILFDHVGAGAFDHRAFNKEKYASLNGYADDIVDIGRALDLKEAVFVGHSVSAMIGIIAGTKAPGMFKSLILVAPSPRYIDDGDYVGGFSRQEIDELLDALDKNHMG